MTRYQERQPVTLIVVEDDELDTMAIKRALRKREYNNPVHFVTSAEEALELLHKREKAERVNQPYLILLDLNMPGVGGLGFLKRIREDARLKKSTVFVITSSDYQGDIAAAYDLNVAAYLVKSKLSENLDQLMDLLDNYVENVEFPPKDANNLNS